MTVTLVCGLFDIFSNDLWCVPFFARAASLRQNVGIFHNFGTGMKSYFSVGLVETKIAIDLLSF